MTKLGFKFLVLLLVPLGASFAQSSTESRINSRVDYFAKYISVFPPDVRDSTQIDTLSRQLTAFIDSVITLRKTGLLGDGEQYYVWMGDLYLYAYNLNIDDSWNKSNEFFKKALEADPTSIKVRMGLASNYCNNWSPTDSTTYSRLDSGYDYLMDVYREGKDTLDETLYHDLFVCGMDFQSRAICYDAMFKYMKYFPGDTEVNEMASAIRAMHDKCVSMEVNKHIITYRDKCAKFEVRYPDGFTLFGEAPGNSADGMARFQIETPVTKTDEGTAIRNSIAIIAIPTSGASGDELFFNFFKRGHLNVDSVRNVPPQNFRTGYFTSHFGIPEEFRGILAITRKDGYYYEISYVATVSTYRKNLAKFLAFERSLVLR